MELTKGALDTLDTYLRQKEEVLNLNDTDWRTSVRTELRKNSSGLPATFAATETHAFGVVRYVNNPIQLTNDSWYTEV